MLGYFPQPLPDETLYSLIARYLLYTLSWKLKPALNKIFDNPHYELRVDLPSSIKAFSSNTFHILNMKEEEVLNKLTLWPYFANFLDESQENYWCHELKGVSSKEFDYQSGLKASSVKRNTIPQYCPICVSNDLKEYNVITWKRKHQIPSILVCSDHNCFLETAYVKDYSAKNYKVIAPTIDSCPITKARNNDNPHIYEIACQMAGLLNGTLKIDSLDGVTLKQIAKKYYAKGSLLDLSTLVSDFNIFYGSTTIILYQKSLARITSKLFGVEYFRNKKTFNPLQTLLFLNFINQKKSQPTPVDFLTKEEICINPVGNHDNKFKVKSDRIGYSTTKSKYYSSFTCECGMKWLRYQGKKDQVGEISITDFGIKWKTNFYQMIDTGKSYDQISEILNVPIKTVVSNAKRRSKFENHKNAINRKKAALVLKRGEYRLAWENEIKENDRFKVKDLAAKRPKEYNWLSLNDQPWLKEIHLKYKLSNSNTASSKKNLYDYDKLDEDLSVKFENAFDELVRNKYKYRITKTALKKAANVSVGFKVIENLPKTKASILRKIESRDDREMRIKKLKN